MQIPRLLSSCRLQLWAEEVAALVGGWIALWQDRREFAWGLNVRVRLCSESNKRMLGEDFVWPRSLERHPQSQSIWEHQRCLNKPYNYEWTYTSLLLPEPGIPWSHRIDERLSIFHWWKTGSERSHCPVPCRTSLFVWL